VLTIISVLAVTAITIMLVSYNRSIKNYKELKGLWDYDTITMYEFDGKGSGALVLPAKKNKFTYTINEDNISIAFEDNKAQDFTCKYAIEDNKLILEKKENKKNKVYKFSKVTDAE
jgi:hypothetical protein